MSAMLGKALEGLGLQPGQTYRATVEGHQVEVRVLDNNTPSPDLTVQVMLQPWVEFPLPASGGRVIARRAPLPLPDPPVIPEDWEVAE